MHTPREMPMWSAWAIAIASFALCISAWAIRAEDWPMSKTLAGVLSLSALRIVPIGVLLGLAVRQTLVGLIVGVIFWMICMAGLLWWFWVLSHA